MAEVDAVIVAYIADIELDLRVLKLNAHVLLLFFVTAEDTDLLDVGIQEPSQHSIAE